MEKLKSIPFYKRFGVWVFLFNAILLLSIIIPTLILQNLDYKSLMDRLSFHTALFDYCAGRLSELKNEDWPAAIEALPRIFYQQRICIFNLRKELVYDSGVMKEFDRRFMFTLLLPHPYIDWTRENRRFDPGVTSSI
jgi:hypothetical protein